MWPISRAKTYTLDNTNATDETSMNCRTQTNGSIRIAQEMLIPEKPAITTQMIIANRSSIVSAMTELSTNTSLGKIASAVSCLIEYRTVIARLVQLEKCVYWTSPTRR